MQQRIPWRIVVTAVAMYGATSATALAQQTKTVTAGPEYEASPTVRRWFGEGYRDDWTTPFEAPVLDLSKEGGGLEPVAQVGGLQTAGLALRGPDGTSYTFRSLHKEPERLLPAEWRDSWPAKMLRDATSATHPGAAVMLPVLAEAAGVPHTQPRLVVMPDDPRLGKFRETFANQVGTIEEYPSAGAGTRRGFEGATEIISTAELWKRWLQGPENRIDSRSFLRARILDLFVDNYDRRRGQWRWMKIPGKTGWQALPEDPDMAFVRHNGVVIAAMRGRQPRLMEFSEKFPSSLEGPTSIAAEVDRWLLSDLEGPVFEQTARELQSAWTDEVIDRAVAQLPKEWQALDKGMLGHALRARRTALVGYVQRFYGFIARVVDIHLTDRDEHVSIAAAPDGSTTVSVTAAGSATPYYTRRFLKDETSEVHVFLHGGNDRVERTGHSNGTHVRVLSDAGEKVVESTDAHSEVWPDGGHVTGTKVHYEGPWKNPQPVSDAPWIEPRDHGSITLLTPMALFTGDLGIVVGATLSRTTYGFRTTPAAKEQVIRGGWSFGRSSGRLEYEGTFRRPASAFGYDLGALASGLERVNFFGLGNDTPEQPRSRYRIHQTVLALSPAVRFGQTPRASFTIGPEIRYSESGKLTNTILFEQSPYGIGRFNLVDVRATFEADTRKNTLPSLLAVATGEAGSDAVDQPPGRGIRVVASTFVAPAALDVQETYGGVDGFVAGYLGGSSVQLALRVGGTRLFGTYPWFDAAVLGGRTDRGFHSHRFSGDASVYGNAELRTYLGGPHFESIFPARFGLVGFVDTGRVWLEGESSKSWHPSAGGGVLLKPVGTTLVFRLIAADGGEGALIYAGSGFRF